MCVTAYVAVDGIVVSPVPGFPFAEGVAQEVNCPLEGADAKAPAPATRRKPLRGQGW